MIRPLDPSLRLSEHRKLVTFTVGGEDYAIDIMKVKEIIQPLKITPVPRAPDFVEGVVELRGAILPVVDLRKRFGAEPRPLGRSGKYLIIAIEGKIVGLIVDAVKEVLTVDPSDIREAPGGDDGSSRYFAGVCHHDGRILLILDIERVLSTRERIDLGGMGRGGA